VTTEEKVVDFQLPEEFQMLKDLVARFVRDELMPLEPTLLAREAAGDSCYLTAEEESTLNKKSAELGLWGLDAPEDVGGSDLPHIAMVGVNEEIGKTVTPYVLPPDSPNLRMLVNTVNEQQKERYLTPYVKDELVSAIAISEPGAGTDPAGMKTSAVKEGDEWVLNGRKIWITKAAEADFTIVMAVTDKVKGARGGISAFLVDKGTPGFEIANKIAMIGGATTYELSLNDCHVPLNNLLGEEGNGFAPMQLRLSSRRLEIAAWCTGIAQRALDMICEYAPQRVTFGKPLAERQNVQWCVADAATRIHACRLMTYDAAWKLDQQRYVRTDISMVKAFATDMAWDVVDQAMQIFGGMGMSKEMPLQQMANNVRLMRIYEGPTEIHRWVVARELLGLKK
jgi:alkylation response protein AidB-like acyl-CoA dehydrogenase